jgi:hypothetical protein
LLLVIVGLAFRLHGLGRLGLVVDEGNQAIAIAGILEHGIPVSDSGWPYARNPLFRYIQAASALGLGLGEFSLRLPSALFATGGANPVAAWEVGARDYGALLDPSKGVISWRAYAGFHQDHKTPSLYVSRNRSAGDRTIVFGPPHMIGVYGYYPDRIDFAIGRPQDRGYLRRRDQENVGWVTGIPTITHHEELIEVLRTPIDGTTWLLGDHVPLLADNPYYAESVKTVIRRLAEKPAYLGLDGQTFVVRIP